MNWFNTAARYQAPLQEVVEPEHVVPYSDTWATDIPPGYEVIQYDDGSWAVLRPPQYPEEPSGKREIKRREKPNKYKSDQQVKKHVIEDAISRIRFVESPEQEYEDDYWLEKFREWQKQKQSKDTIPKQVQSWAIRTIIKHANKIKNH